MLSEIFFFANTCLVKFKVKKSSKSVFKIKLPLTANMMKIIILCITTLLNLSNSQPVSSQSDICNSAGCISAAHSLIQNMNLYKTSQNGYLIAAADGRAV